MRKKSYLIIAGSLNFFIAILHVATIFVGAPAYYFLDAPELAIYTELGFIFPAWITLFITLVFFFFGLYAFCGAGGKIKLPWQNLMLKIIGTLFLVRGLALFWYGYVQFTSPTESSLKEIVFSSVALILGLLYWMGVKKKAQMQSV